MYTKLFSHITESTIWHEEDPIRLVWITMLAMCDREGFVHSSVLGVATRARVTREKTEEAIAKFLAPDELSMSKEYEGRRIETVEGGWRLLNYVKYRDIKTAEERREYMRNWMREKRGKTKNVSKLVSKVNSALADVNDVSPSDTDTYSESDNPKKQSAKFHFSLPSLGEITAYCQERGNNVDPQQFFNHYTSNGWKVGRNNMKDWHAAVRTWEKRDFNQGGQNGANQPTKTERRVSHNREAILAGLGIGQAARPDEPDLQDRTDAGRGPSMAKLLRD